jgi:hypothetical protein
LKHEECIKKMQYLSICSAASENNHLTFEKLSTLLKIKKEEVEDWIIDAISNNLIDARVDQLEETVTIFTFTQRSIQEGQWKGIQEKLGHWISNFEKTLDLLKQD